MSCVWITDIHLNFIPDPAKREEFYTTLKDYDCVLISGDIGHANSFARYLKEMYVSINNRPIYFVLGNHDYYGSDVQTVRKIATNITNDFDTNNNIIYLTTSPIFIQIKPGKFICGVDGWADGRAGNYAQSKIVLNDSIMIEDLKYASIIGGKSVLKYKMQSLADTDTFHLENDIEQIIAEYEQAVTEIVILTHVPPFRETCLYLGKQSGEDFIPFFCNVGLGNMLMNKALLFPNIKFTVLCGHTHGPVGPYYKLQNLKVIVGGGQYKYPEIAGVIFDEEDTCI